MIMCALVAMAAMMSAAVVVVRVVVVVMEAVEEGGWLGNLRMACWAGGKWTKWRITLNRWKDSG